jgi:hypothetical protein
MQGQYEKMLKLTSDAFVFSYTDGGVWVAAATAVLGNQSSHLNNLYTQTIDQFFELHLESFVGDRRISSTSMNALVELARVYEVRAGLIMELSPRNPGDPVPETERRTY